MKNEQIQRKKRRALEVLINNLFSTASTMSNQHIDDFNEFMKKI